MPARVTPRCRHPFHACMDTLRVLLCVAARAEHANDRQDGCPRASRASAVSCSCVRLCPTYHVRSSAFCWAGAAWASIRCADVSMFRFADAMTSSRRTGRSVHNGPCSRRSWTMTPSAHRWDGWRCSRMQQATRARWAACCASEWLRSRTWGSSWANLGWTRGAWWWP